MPTFGTTKVSYGAFMQSREIFRPLEADRRWFVYAAGWVDPGDGNNATISLEYEKDDESFIVLGSVVASGAGRVKASIGPLDLFATAGVPGTESIVSIRLRAVKASGVDGTMDGWNIWVRKMQFQG